MGRISVYVISLFVLSSLISGCFGKKYVLKDNLKNTALITFNNSDRRSSATICQKGNSGSPAEYRGPEVDEKERKVYGHKTVKVSTDEPVFIQYEFLVSAYHNEVCRASLYLDLTAGRHYNLAMLTRTSESSLPGWLQAALLMTPSVKSCYIGIDKQGLVSSEISYTPAVKPVRKSAVNCRSVVSGVPDMLKLTALDVDDWVDNVMEKYRHSYRVGSYAIVANSSKDSVGYFDFKEDYKECFESMGGNAKSVEGKNGQFDLLKCMLLKKNDTNNEKKWKMVR